MELVKDCKQQKHLLLMEVKVLSARSLKAPPSLFSGRLRPYVTLSAASTPVPPREQDEPPCPVASVDAQKSGGIYRTRVDEHGGENPTWGDSVCLPLDPSFLHQGAAAAVHLLVLSKRRLAAPARLGWCRIAASDLVDGLRPPWSVRRLSYALRNCRHGGRGHGVVDLAARLVGPALSTAPPPAAATAPVLGVLPASEWAGEVAVGIPVRALGLVGTMAPGGRKEPGIGDSGNGRGVITGKRGPWVGLGMSTRKRDAAALRNDRMRTQTEDNRAGLTI